MYIDRTSVYFVWRFWVFVVIMSDDWVSVPPRRRARKPIVEEEASSPKNTLRSASFGEILDVPGKIAMGKTAHREAKLEWSAKKRRERTARIDKRNMQREASRTPEPNA